MTGDSLGKFYLKFEKRTGYCYASSMWLYHLLWRMSCWWDRFLDSFCAQQNNNLCTTKTVLHTIASMAISITLYRKWILWWEKLIDYCTLITLTPKNSFLVWTKFFPYNFCFSSHFQMLPLLFFSFQLQSLPWT